MISPLIEIKDWILIKIRIDPARRIRSILCSTRPGCPIMSDLRCQPMQMNGYWRLCDAVSPQVDHPCRFHCFAHVREIESIDYNDVAGLGVFDVIGHRAVLKVDNEMFFSKRRGAVAVSFTISSLNSSLYCIIEFFYVLRHFPCSYLFMAGITYHLSRYPFGCEKVKKFAHKLNFVFREKIKIDLCFRHRFDSHNIIKRLKMIRFGRLVLLLNIDFHGNGPVIHSRISEVQCGFARFNEAFKIEERQIFV